MRLILTEEREVSKILKNDSIEEVSLQSIPFETSLTALFLRFVVDDTKYIESKATKGEAT